MKKKKNCTINKKSSICAFEIFGDTNAWSKTSIRGVERNT